MELRRDNSSNFKMPVRADGIVGVEGPRSIIPEEQSQRLRARLIYLLRCQVDQLVKAQ